MQASGARSWAIILILGIGLGISAFATISIESSPPFNDAILLQNP
jgi:hypothetical protein